MKGREGEKVNKSHRKTYRTQVKTQVSFFPEALVLITVRCCFSYFVFFLPLPVSRPFLVSRKPKHVLLLSTQSLCTRWPHAPCHRNPLAMRVGSQSCFVLQWTWLSPAELNFSLALVWSHSQTCRYILVSQDCHLAISEMWGALVFCLHLTLAILCIYLAPRTQMWPQQPWLVPLRGLSRVSRERGYTVTNSSP